MKNQWFRNLLRCPQCIGQLIVDNEVSCELCGFSDDTGKDLRLVHPDNVQLTVPRMQSIHPDGALAGIDTSWPVITYAGPAAIRDSRQLMSEVSNRLPRGGTVLDLGCGPRDQFAPLTHLGFKYVGVDYANPAADLLADAHSIPFADDSFDCVFSYAVLEHLHNPFIAIREISRVLKPGGRFIGTVSQGEPFHSSYFHHTPWGLLSLIGSSPELTIVRMWDSSDTLQSLASMGRYSRLLRAALGGLDLVNTWMPWITPRKMMWPLKAKQLDRLYRAGSICFSIQKVSPTKGNG